MADDNDTKNQRRLKVKKIRERIERLVQQSRINLDFYASVAAQLERANKQIDDGQRQDEFNQEDLADQRVKNQAGDEDEEEENEEQPEQPEPEQPEQQEQQERQEPEQPEDQPSARKDQLEKLRQARETYQKVQKAAETAKKMEEAAKSAKTVATVGAFLAETWWIWVILLVLLLLVALAYMIFGGAGNKVLDMAGGSIPIAMDYQNKERQKLVADVEGLVKDGALLMNENSAKDLSWQSDKNGKPIHALVWRTMETLSYLAGKYKIGVKFLKSNGPDMTRRMPVAKGKENSEPIDAPSAYSFGQGIAITSIGVTSLELTEAMGLPQPVPVQVNWQKQVVEKALRPIYEQLQVDARALFNATVQANAQADTDEKGLEVLARAHEQAVTDSAKNPQAKIKDNYMIAKEALDNLIINLERMREVGKCWEEKPWLDPRACRFSTKASGYLGGASGLFEKSGTAFIDGWGEETDSGPIHQGLWATFRAMQVANMLGWNGNEEEIDLWKAYEARQNIRKLALDILRMPVALAGEGQDFNADLVAKQLIIYSPEDDLDNGLPDFDVYPRGTIAVDEGGVGYDSTGHDNVIDVRDNHFMSLPIDGGIFSKLGTVFIYKTDSAGQIAKEILEWAAASFTLGGSKMMDLWDGGGIEKPGEERVKVSYRSFVHIGF